MLLTPPTARALLLEDNPADARLVRELLAESPDGFALTVADRLSAALELLAREQFAVVLVDLGLPDAARLEALDALRAQVGATPVVVYSGGADDALAEQARSLGVCDVLRKGALDGAALTAALRTIVDAAAFSGAVRERLRGAKATGEDVAVIRLVVERPLDAGSLRSTPDGLLAHAVGERLAGRLAPDDGLFHLGDGRYGVVAAVNGGSSGAAWLAQELRHALDRPVTHDGTPVTLRARTGHAFAPGGAGTADAMLERATTALRESTAPSMAAPLRVEPTSDGPSFATRLRRAIRDGQLVLHYQPIVRLGDDEIPVVEALVRWNDPVRGLLPPAEFIPLAEETSLIEEIGAWALLEACRQLRAWDDAGVAPVRCAVNLSARELCSPALPARVADALALSGIAAGRLEIELTESMFADPEATSQMIARLRALGVRVAIDDFGTGYSSLAYLTRFAVDTIKVDGSFVRRAAADPDAAAVVKAIVGIAHQLELEVVAEGVETVEQLSFAREQGCDLVQGWLFAAAMPGPEAAEWLGWARDRVAKRKAEEAGRAVQPEPLPFQQPVKLPAAAYAALPQAAPALLKNGMANPGGIAGARKRSPARAFADRVTVLVTLAVGALLGYVLAFPVTMPAAGECPAAAEGRSFCDFQKGYMPSIMIFLACLLGVLVAVEFVRRLPRRLRARRVQRDHDRRRAAEAERRSAALAERRRSAAPPSAPLLLAESYKAAARG